MEAVPGLIQVCCLLNIICDSVTKVLFLDVIKTFSFKSVMNCKIALKLHLAFNFVLIFEGGVSEGKDRKIQ